MKGCQSNNLFQRTAWVITIIGLAGFGSIHAGSPVFFECSNSASPVISDRSDLIRGYCDGELAQRTMTLENLMRAMENVQKALRAITVSRSSELSGPESLSAKMSVYADSIGFVSRSAKQFPPKKNPEKIDQYLAMYDELNVHVSGMKSVISMKDQAGSKEDMAKFYSRLTGTCKTCHANFR